MYLAVALMDGALEYLETLVLFTVEDALEDLLDDEDAGGGREALGDLTLSIILMLLTAVSTRSEISVKYFEKVVSHFNTHNLYFYASDAFDTLGCIKYCLDHL